jgi:hypothetical protein
VDKAKRDWILNNVWTFILGVLLIGPFALPLLWRNPRYDRTTKVLWSVIVLAFTAFLIWGSAKLSQMALDVLQP